MAPKSHGRRARSLEAIKARCYKRGISFNTFTHSPALRVHWSPFLDVVWHPYQGEPNITGDYFRTKGVGMAEGGVFHNCDSDYAEDREKLGELCDELMDFFFHPKES